MLYTKEDIKRIIPHREPMLMVDEIIEGKKVLQNADMGLA